MRSTIVQSLLAKVLLLAALPLSGCSVDETLNPVPTAAPVVDAGVDAPEPPPPPPDAGPWKRSIITRSPFGGPSGNLLADGDYEFSTAGGPGAQLGWRGFSSNGSGLADVKTETGGLCRSGLRCAVFEPKTLHFLLGTAAAGTGNVASVWAKLPAGSPCKAVVAALVRNDDFVVLTKLGSDKEPDAEGYCHYTVRIAEKSEAIGIYLENSLKTGTHALVDNAVIAPDDGTIHPKSAEHWAPPAELVERLAAIRETIRRSTPPPRRAPRVVPAD